MPEYSVNMTKIPWLEVGNSDVIFHIKRDEEKLGGLRISKGHIVWTPANKKFSYWLSWNDFDKIITQNGQQRIASY